MTRSLWLPGTLLGLVVLLPATVAADREPPKEVPARLAELLKDTPEEFIKRFDRNNDGVLTKDELPPRLAERFDEIDSNGDGKLDAREVGQLLRRLRQRLGQNGDGVDRAQVERVVDRLLEEQDTNRDGKISKEEAKRRLAENFDRLDTNKDGYLDRDELRRAALVFLRNQAGAGSGDRPGAGSTTAEIPDFDALDRDADGRLTLAEVKGTPLAEHFDEIDTNKDGKIDRKEFQAYFKKVREKKD